MNVKPTYGYNDILKVGDSVQVNNIEVVHKSTISELVELNHCTIYRLTNPQWDLNWHFRIYLTKL